VAADRDHRRDGATIGTGSGGAGRAPGVGPLFHGTKADLKPGDLLAPGYGSNFGKRAKVNFIYLTDMRFPGNPTRLYRTWDPLRALHEVLGWAPHPREVRQQRLDHLAETKRLGTEAIKD